MEEKNYYEELMEKYDNWEDLVKSLIEVRLEDYRGNSYYGCDLAYTLFEEENINGSFTYSTYWSKQLIFKYWNELAEIYSEYLDNLGIENAINILGEEEKFIVIMLLEQANDILSKNNFIDENWNNEFELNDENIKKIIESM